VSLTAVSAGNPTTYGNQLLNGSGTDKATFNPNTPVANSINVNGSNGSYVPGFANAIGTGGAGQNKFYVEAAGFIPVGDQEVYALNITTGGVDINDSQEATLASEINASQTGTGVTAVSHTANPALAALFPGYDIFLTTNTAPSSPMFLGLDFSGETSVGSLLVTDVAAVPEPASAAGILLGAAGLLLGRRKRNA